VRRAPRVDDGDAAILEMFEQEVDGDERMRHSREPSLRPERPGG
jgi:hypothetical protein